MPKKEEKGVEESKKGPPRKRSQFACTRCRDRKVKCDAQKPRCGFCQNGNLECVYERTPTLSFVNSLEERIKFLEDSIASIDADSGGNDAQSTNRRLFELVQSIRKGDAGVVVGRLEKKQRAESSSAGAGASASASGGVKSEQSNPPRSHSVHFLLNQKHEHQQQLRFDEEGHLAHHGPTSFFYASGQALYDNSGPSGAQVARRGTSETYQRGSPPLHATKSGRGTPSKRARLDSEAQNESVNPSSSTSMSANVQLILNSTQEREAEWFGFHNLETHFPTFTQETYKRLLDLHWCWINPIFNFLYRPAFTRDMAAYPLSGASFSSFLLYVVLAHATRFDVQNKEVPQPSHDVLPSNQGEVFLKHARVHLVRELDAPGTLSTCQGLLLLSASENSRGHVSQAWQYSGLAFRIMTNLGIHLDGDLADSEHPFTNEEIEQRKRLFWACYVWDKIISLYYGRAPVIERTTLSPTREFKDQYGEVDSWMPLPFNNFNKGKEAHQGGNYKVRPAYAVSCFAAACQQAEGLHHILIYENSGKKNPDYLDRASKLLWGGWDKEIVENLKIDTDHLPDTCPPAHISNLNCLHHTFSILLEKSQNSIHMPSPAIFKAALDIIAISRLHRKTFGKGLFVFSHAYCIMVASNTLVATLMGSMLEEHIDSLYWGFILVSALAYRASGLRRPLKRLAQRILHLSLAQSSPLRYVAEDYLGRTEEADFQFDLGPEDNELQSVTQAGQGNLDPIKAINEQPVQFWVGLDMDISQFMQEV